MAFDNVPDDVLDHMSADDLLIHSMKAGGIEIEKEALLAMSIQRAEANLARRRNERAERKRVDRC